MSENRKKKNGALKGAIVGDIVGSIYEWNNIKTKEFAFFGTHHNCKFTDDTVMSVAVAKAFMKAAEKETGLYQELVTSMQRFGRDYPHRGYGGRFRSWLTEKDPQPYYSWGNGAPMRCSPAGMLADSAEEASALGKKTAMPTHNHPEGLKAAGLTAELIFRARQGETMEQLRKRAEKEYEIRSCDSIRPWYEFDVSSQGTMPAALAAFLESTSFEDAIRNAVSLGGDSDTIAAITGSMAEAYWGMPDEIWAEAAKYLDADLRNTVDEFYAFSEKGSMPERYRIELHMHTSETSDCASGTAAEMMKMYSMRGFSTVVVTDHFSKKYLKQCPVEEYEGKVELFFDGFDEAKKAGKKYGIIVLFGVELRLRGSRNHYLAYGIDRDFLLTHPGIVDMDIKEFHELAKENDILVIQAHPFRKDCFPTPENVDGLEVRNANPKYYELEEEKYIKKIARGYGLIQTGGSDTHEFEAAGLSGITAVNRPETMDELKEILKNGAFEII